MTNNYITVSALNNYLKRKFEADVHLNKVYLKGEISNLKAHSRGHLYFSLKDETSVISAIMFDGNAKTLNFEPKEGTKVFVEGKITVYEASGKYQIIVDKMSPDGIGELYIAYEKLKKELEKEGLFDAKYKKPIPKYPKRIGIITAPTGAAIRDILSTIKRRFPICETILFPALVQGNDAKYSIVNQLKNANEYDLDVIILGRGGGSIEDLWAFNEEMVAREIFVSKIPIISAVGHEVDFTISDFVSDLRAPTPTGAAELAVPNMSDVFSLIQNYEIRITENINNRIKFCERKLDALKNSYILKNPLAIYEVQEQKLSNLMDKLLKEIKTKLDFYQNKILHLKESYVLKNPLSVYDKEKEKVKTYKEKLSLIIDYKLKEHSKIFDLYINKLELLSPLNVLKKGYSLVTLDHVVVSDASNLKINDNVLIQMDKGKIKAEVKEIEGD